MDAFLHQLDWVLPLRNELLNVIFKGITSLGEANIILMILVIFYWIINRQGGNRLAIIVLTTVLLNSFLKDLWQNPRPELKYVLDGSMTKSFGAPSGHTQIAVVMWLWMAREIGKRWAWTVAVIIAAGVGFSRLYLGEHDVEDVLAGLGIALGTLLLFRWALFPLFERWRGLSPLVPIGVTAAGLAVLYGSRPVETVPKNLLLIGGFLMGWLGGVAFLNRKAFDARRLTLWRTLLAALVGVALLGLVMMGLRSILVSLDLPEPIARLIGGLIVGLTATGLVPPLLVRFKLMQKVEPGRT
jgi:membrane-associated phospholipid phosphatase